jgi:uncharacterized protein (DUF488 family)
MMSDARPPLFTIGHSTRTVAEFVALLKLAPVEMVVDIRKFPRSRTNPQFNGDTLPGALAPCRIAYSRIDALGGRRTRSRDVPPSVNGYWSNPGFHNYADYALSDDFRAGLEALALLSEARQVAIMCSEAVWWRCHRRFVADYLLKDGRDVFHLMDPGRRDIARMTPAARASGISLVYPAASEAPE